MDANKRPLVVNNHTHCAGWSDLMMTLLPKFKHPLARQDNIPGCVRSSANQRACKRASCRRQDSL